jgi:hypothetical protein
MNIITMAAQLLSYSAQVQNKFLFSLVIIVISLHDVNAQTLSFPGAEGFGKYATGGRGGSVIKVTNLNASGVGSLRAALEASGARTVIFEVGGTIDLAATNIYVSNGDLTIAGQTAPGDGILIKGGQIQFEASNVICRYLRVRPGSGALPGYDGISVMGNNEVTENVIIDHCSISWAGDENFNTRTLGTGIVRNVTLQNCIIAECGYAFLNSEGRNYNISVYNNAFILNNDRHIRSQGSGYLGNTYFDFEMINNIVYGSKHNSNFSYGHKMSAINNYWKLSSEVSNSSFDLYKTLPEFGGVLADTDACIMGNIVPSGHEEYESELIPYITNVPYASSGIVPIEAVDLDANLLPHVGASFPTRDAVDNRLIDDYNNGNGTLATNGTYPTLAGGTAPTDTDDDGMPDFWETENGLDLNDPSDRNIVQSDGYTNLEYYLNNLFFLNDGVVNANAGSDKNICEGSSATLSASGGNSYLWSTGETTQSITVTPNTTTTYTVTAYDATGANSDTDDVIVTVNPMPTANAGADVETCLGSPVTLTASGGTSYIWSTGATSASINVNPNTTTTYTVEVIQNNCSDTDEVTVTVNPLPNTDAGTDVTINSGESTTLTATGADSYLWSTGETTASITVSPTVDTTYTVIGTINNCESSDTVTVFSVDGSVTANAGDDTEICNGESTTLTATGGTDYLWNTGATTQSITVSPNVTTTYSVTVSNGTNSDTDDVVVTVNPKPTANAGADVTISEGESTTLTASGGDSYVWSTGETTPSITVNPSVTTTYTVIALLNGCEDSDDVIVTVNTAQVVANAGSDQNICQGNSTTLTAYGGTDYLWSTGETTQSIEVSPNSTTNYTVIVSNATSSDTDDVTVMVNPVPEVAVSDDATILEGNYITLSASGANHYEWSNGATQPNIAVSPSVSTTYVVTGYINDCYDVKDVTVSVVQQVEADAGEDKSICAGTEVTLTATSSGGEDYLWNTGETTQSITVSPEVDTIYTVIVSNSLDSDADEIMVSVDACEENIIPEDPVFMFHTYVDSRRSDDILNIKLAGLKGECELHVFDITGKKIHSDFFDGNDGQEIVRTLNTSQISDGVYIIKVAEKGELHSKSIIIR